MLRYSLRVGGVGGGGGVVVGVGVESVRYLLYVFQGNLLEIGGYGILIFFVVHNTFKFARHMWKPYGNSTWISKVCKFVWRLISSSDPHPTPTHTHITDAQTSLLYSMTPPNVQGAVSIRKTVLPGMAIPMLKIRRPNGRLIFNMEIAIRR